MLDFPPEEGSGASGYVLALGTGEGRLQERKVVVWRALHLVIDE